MRLLVRALMFGMLVLGSCSKHPLAGGWHEHVAGGGEGLELDFDPNSQQLLVHGRPRPDGGHDDLRGTYSLDGEALTVEWTDAGKKVTLRGSLRGDEITLGATDQPALEFHRGEAGHHH